MRLGAGRPQHFLAGASRECLPGAASFDAVSLWRSNAHRHTNEAAVGKTKDSLACNLEVPQALIWLLVHAWSRRCLQDRKRSAMREIKEALLTGLEAVAVLGALLLLPCTLALVTFGCDSRAYCLSWCWWRLPAPPSSQLLLPTKAGTAITCRAWWGRTGAPTARP